ncbi:hypothetical protein AYI69_g1668 [Smittium culicis]|uniref:Enhancer of mRNA-decapping protein 4 n=1 Tax=Smittium culicis TaxID=133412 RepID=A0A1R1YPL4_9FUNG|nr:hypothetical protein AYI69_g1668 [Smittium culicis]
MSSKIDVDKAATSKSLLSVFNNPNFSGFKNTYQDITSSIQNKSPTSPAELQSSPAQPNNPTELPKSVVLSQLSAIASSNNSLISSNQNSPLQALDSFNNGLAKTHNIHDLNNFDSSSLSPRDRDAHKLIMMLKGFDHLLPSNSSKSTPDASISNKDTAHQSPKHQTVPSFPPSTSQEPTLPRFDNPIDPFNFIVDTIEPIKSPIPISIEPKNSLPSPSSKINSPALSDSKRSSDSKKNKKKRSKKPSHIPYGDPNIQSNFHSKERIAIVSTPPDGSSKRAIGASSAFICYGKRGGDIRAIQQWSDHRSLLVGHTSDVVQILFHPYSKLYPENNSILASVGSDNSVIIWFLDINNTSKVLKNSSNPENTNLGSFDSKLAEKFLIDPSETIVSIEWCPEFYNLKPEGFDFAVLAIATDCNLYILTISTCPTTSSKLVASTFSSQSIFNSSISAISWVKRSFGWDIFVCSVDGSLKRLSYSTTSNPPSIQFLPISSSLGSNVSWMKWVSPFTLAEGLGHLLVAHSNSSLLELRWLGPDSDVLGGNVSNIVHKLDMLMIPPNAEKKNIIGSPKSSFNLNDNINLEYEDISHTLVVISKITPSIVFIPIVIDSSQPSNVCFETSTTVSLPNTESTQNVIDHHSRKISQISNTLSESVIVCDITVEENGNGQNVIGLYCVFPSEITQYNMHISLPSVNPIRLHNTDDSDKDLISSLDAIMISNDSRIKNSISQDIEDQISHSNLTGAEYLEWMLNQAASLRPRALSTNQGTVDTNDFETTSSIGYTNYSTSSPLSKGLFRSKSPNTNDDFKSVTSTNCNPSYTPRIIESKDEYLNPFTDIVKGIDQLNISINDDESRAQESFLLNRNDNSTKEFSSGLYNNKNSISRESSIDNNNHLGNALSLKNDSKDVDYGKINNLIKEAVNSSISDILFSNQFKSMINSSVQEALASSIGPTLVSSLNSSVKTAMQSCLIPSYNRATSEMFEQINQTFSSGVAQLIDSASSLIKNSIPENSNNQPDLLNQSNPNYNFPPVGTNQQQSSNTNNNSNPANMINQLNNQYLLSHETPNIINFNDNAHPNQHVGNQDFLSNNPQVDLFQNQQNFISNQNQHNFIPNQNQQNFIPNQNRQSLIITPNQNDIYQTQGQLNQFPILNNNTAIPAQPQHILNPMNSLPPNNNSIANQNLYMLQLQQIQGQLNLNQMTNSSFPPNIQQDFNNNPISANQYSQPPNQPIGQIVQNLEPPSTKQDNRINSLVALLNSGTNTNSNIGATTVVKSPRPINKKKSIDVSGSDTNVEPNLINQNLGSLNMSSPIGGSSEPKSPKGQSHSPFLINENMSKPNTQHKKSQKVASKSAKQNAQKTPLAQTPRSQSGSRISAFDVSSIGNEIYKSKVLIDNSKSSAAPKTQKNDDMSPCHAAEDVVLAETARMIERKSDPRDILILALSTKLSRGDSIPNKNSNPLHIVFKVIGLLNSEEIALDSTDMDLDFLFSLIYSLVINPDLAYNNVELMEKYLFIFLNKLKKTNARISNSYGWNSLESNGESENEKEISLKELLGELFAANIALSEEAGGGNKDISIVDDGLLPVKTAVFKCLELVSLRLEDCDTDNDVRLLAKVRTLIRLVQSL